MLRVYENGFVAKYMIYNEILLDPTAFCAHSKYPSFICTLLNIGGYS